MSTTSRPDLHFARRELLDLRRDRDIAATRARSAAADAAAMRRVATDIERITEPLYTALEPVTAIHTTATWEGRAATASRTRLARFDEQRAAALGSIGNLITELRSTAARFEHTAETQWGDHAVFSSQIRGLEELLAGPGSASDRIR